MEITKKLYSSKLLSDFTILLFNLVLGGIRKFYSLRQNEEGSIVVIALHKLGDTVYTIPAIKEIKKHYKKSIYLLCYSESIAIYKQGIDYPQFIALERSDFYCNNRIASHSGRVRLRELKPEIIIDLTGVMTSASLIFNTNARMIIGMNRKQFKAIYDLYTSTEYKDHLMDMYINVVALIIPSVDYKAVSTFKCNITSINKILIHPFAGWGAKEWGLKKFISLADRLSKKYIVSIVVPQNKLSADTISEIIKMKFEVIVTNTIEDLIELIKKYSLLIGNDSGPIHIASLLGKATFTIYGPTSPLIHIPIGQHHEYINKKLRCSPSGTDKMCFTNAGRNGCPSFECMNTLTLQSVIEKVQFFIDNFNEINNKS